MTPSEPPATPPRRSSGFNRGDAAPTERIPHGTPTDPISSPIQTPGDRRARNETGSSSSSRPSTRGPIRERDIQKEDRRARNAALAKAAGKGVATGAKATARGIQATARFTGTTTKKATEAFQRYAGARGASETGLSRLVELHFSSTVGDTIMTLSLAGTMFFAAPTQQARGQVALFLLLTMVPFALMAPFVGPVLDRFRYGRRWAIGATMALRAFLCWVLAEGIDNNSTWLYPAALGCLVSSRAYQVTRASAVPRLLPDEYTLVSANSRVSMAGVIGAVLGGIAGMAFSRFGAAWSLRLAFAVFVFSTIQSIRLPAAIDSTAGEEGLEDVNAPDADQMNPNPGGPPTRPIPVGAGGTGDAGGPIGRDTMMLRMRRRVASMPWPVMHALWSTAGTRILTGFEIMFLAFLTREHPIDNLRTEVVLGLVAAGAGVGNALGSAMGGFVRGHSPERIAALVLILSIVTCGLTAVFYSLWTLIAVGFVNGFAAQVAKLCLDALVQRDIPESVRTSVFAWSETQLQVMWVIGGGLGISLPLIPTLGFWVVAVALAITLFMAARAKFIRTHPSRADRSRGHTLNG